MSPKPIRAKDARTISLEIDHRPVECPEGVSVLRAAELNGVEIPSLCSHKDLSPFGGCRLCMVEIEGMRGYPLACSTIAAEGMKVLSESSVLREMRREILELILSEHPSSCLICSEKVECRSNVDTIRKAGVSTGCRYCPNDGQCDLQSLVDRLGVTELHYPVLYHGYEPEHDDPFFDRDYNICILCGRCVRMCQEVRGTGVLAFKHRGPKTRIGPAFGRSHVQAGCEFCGACVTVCPTGALTEKASKWDGQPDGFEVSTCPFCSLGCRIELHHKQGRLSRVEPHLDPEINDGQLCVRGRFCLPETTHHHERARKPELQRGRYVREVTWPEALAEAAGHLRKVRPEEILMVVSPDLTNESLYAAQKFARSCLQTGNIDSTARWALPGGVEQWVQLFTLPISIRDLGHADSLIAVGLDSRFSFSVAGVEVRRALREGATLVAIDPRESNLAQSAQHWLRPSPGGEGIVLRALAEIVLDGPGQAEVLAAAARTGVRKSDLRRAAKALAPGRDLGIVAGPRAFAVDPGFHLGQALLRLAARERTTFLPLVHGANTRGVVELGVLGGWLPGPKKAEGARISLEDLLDGRARPKVIYLVGEAPFSERPDCDVVIAQDLYHPPFQVDVFLPAASFAEAGGTLTNIEGRVQEIVGIENLPDGAITGFSRPDWFIFSALSAAMDSAGCRFESAEEIRSEIHQAIPGFPDAPDRRPRRMIASSATPEVTPPVTPPRLRGRRLVVEPGEFRHRGIDLSFVVEGLSELRLEEGLRMHPDDLEELGLEDGVPASVASNGVRVITPVRADADCPRGAVYVNRPSAFGGLAHRRDLEPLYRLNGDPRRITVRPGERTRGEQMREDGACTESSTGG